MQFILILHSILRWGILIVGLWTVINAVTGVSSKRAYTAADNRSNLLFMIFFDLQLLIGLILYFVNGWFDKLKQFSVYKSDAPTRFFMLEHLTMMILAWILVHVGRSAVKKAGTDAAKHKKMLIFFGIAFILILASIPWPFRNAVARPWF
ncbi:MAG: hypothetical protein QM791_14565 [Ferruginibacter sp.]